MAGKSDETVMRRSLSNNLVVPTGSESTPEFIVFILNNGTSSEEDVLQINLDRVITTLMPPWAYHSAAAYLVVITLVGLFLNGCVIWVILHDQQVRNPPTARLFARVSLSCLKWQLFLSHPDGSK